MRPITPILILVALGIPLTMARAQSGVADAMAQSVGLQRASVRLQAGVTEESDFFLIPWSEPLAVPEDGGASYCERISPSQLDGYLNEISKREGFTPDLLRAVISKESAFQPCAVSSKGAQGLMQLMPETAAELGVFNPFNPLENVDAGARYLGQLLTRYGGDLTKALGAYNAGPSRVDEFDGLPPMPETMNYVADILKSLDIQDPKPADLPVATSH